MTDTKALRDIIEEKGIKYKVIAKNIGITPYGLQKKVDNDNQFKADEIVSISNILRLTPKQRDAIFFAKPVDF